MVDSLGHRIQYGLFNPKKKIPGHDLSNNNFQWNPIFNFQTMINPKLCQTMQKDIEKTIVTECEHVFYVPGIVHSVGKSNY